MKKSQCVFLKQMNDYCSVNKNHSIDLYENAGKNYATLVFTFIIRFQKADGSG